MTSTPLQAALRAGADGLCALEADTRLVIAHGTWTGRRDFGDFIHHGTGTAAIDWEAAITALDGGLLPASAGEKRMLRLGDAVTGIEAERRPGDHSGPARYQAPPVPAVTPATRSSATAHPPLQTNPRVRSIHAA